jgi:hypothetical protein
MDTVQRRRAAVVGLFIAFAGVITLAVAAYRAFTIIRVLKTWTPVQAQLIDTTIRNERSFASMQLSRTANYLVTWTFRYNANGYPHLSSADPGTHGSYNEMLRWSRRFHPGETVTTRYDPNNPDIISAAQWDWITFAHAIRVGCWGIGIIAVGLLMRFIARRMSFYVAKANPKTN